ncbi:phosphotransferase system, HPr-related protein [Pseudomonas taiwanensis]|uniref:phosphotransferase system, HPr-related protein n=1 Tax=Pseudomonas taiwanensis TaxID=470150 RepID=UPI0015BD85DB|nr:phosphotransferase system, HPr-related protein [Pseudomonas taiwanensis]NWL76467.1 phosphotransferase system, HPr-related protein [Pseudomonas taiwanensis]
MIRDKPASRESDVTERSMGSTRELDFSEERDTREGSIEDLRPTGEIEREVPAESVVERGGESPDDNPREDNVTPDDLSPDTLYDQTGARSPEEREGDSPADQELRTVPESEIGGGIGLDEAELGRSAPLDGKPWTDRVSPVDGSEDE